MESNKFDAKLNLLNKIPEELLYKVVPLSQNEKINKGNIEIVVLFGNNLDKVTRSVEAIGGTFENLGYGFGIVTVKSEDIRKISELQGVQYVELPKVLFTSDFESNKASCVPNAWDRYGLTGEGVLVGFIDTGIDYTHPAFRDEEGNTRIDFIYDLAEDRKVYDKAQINEALKAPDPYAIVNVRDPLDHGTHVAGIACAGGNIPKQNYGVAFKSSIAMVKTTRYGFLNFALSTQIMRGIKFLVDKSNEMNKPLAINISLSTNDGAHNGTSLLEQYIETICRLERVAIVIAAGNEGDAAHHVGGELSDINVIPLSVSDSEMALSLQLYKPLLVDISIEIENPLGEKSGEIVIRNGYRELNIGVDKCLIYNTGPKPFDINGEISISLLPGLQYLPSGEWKVTLKVLNKYRGIYDIWLPITEAINEKTRFLKPDVYNTLGIPATVQSAISVGSYNNMTNTFSSFSGRGKIYRTSFEKPDIVAPGEDILSTVSNRGFDTKTGTSMASPNVAGICALLLEWGIVKGNDPFLYGERLKYYLSKGAKRDRLEIPYPDPRWGYGTVCAYDSLNLLQLANVRGQSRLEENMTDEEFFTLIDTVFSPIEYIGDIAGAVSKISNARIFIADKTRAILAVRGDVQEVIDKLFDVIVYVNPSGLYTLCDISPVEASGATTFHNSTYLPLDGLGVTVGIIDTGIDYLNEEFINEDNTSRILTIWDQTIPSSKRREDLFGGSEYTREEINRAIKAKMDGQDPYAIIPSKDEVGHGTSMAGIVGARGVNPEVIGVAPRCNFAIVKLGPRPEVLNDYFGVYGDAPTFSTSVVFLGIKYLYDLARRLKIPMVILVPLGASRGGRNGLSLTERYIDEISRAVGITVVVPIGNEGDSDNHSSGTIVNEGDTQNIELKIDKNQKNINFEIWINKPDKFALSIISPSGEIIDRIPPSVNKITEIKFIYEGTIIYVEYFIPEVLTGDEKITINARNIKEGIWGFKLIGELVVTGRYDAYLIQRDLLAPGTRFLNPDPYVTLTIPSSSSYAISVGYYNQNNNSNVRESSRGYTRDNRIKPDVVAGGVNALVTAVGSGTQVVSGSSVAAAVVAGCSALIFQWGIIDGNDTSLYSTKVKTYLIGGTSKREGDIYPNPQWGYGAVDMKGVFNNIRLKPSNGRRDWRLEENIENIPGAEVFEIPKNISATIEYQGDIESAIKKVPNARVFIIDEKRAIVVAEENLQEVLDKLSDVIVQVIPDLTDKEFVVLPESTFATIEYQKDIVSAVKEIPNARVVIVDKKRAILVVIGSIQDIQEVLDKLSDVIIYAVPTVLHTLCDISPLDASGASTFHNSIYLPLDGSGVTVGIVDSGIDYLNEEFINEDGTSRILSIWDEEISTGKSPEGQFGGSEYTREEINNAIKAKSEGKDPYEIVPSKDIIGHGTSMASIIGARGVKPEVIGVAPKCNFAIVKLISAPLTVRDDFGMYGNVTTYSTSAVFSGIKYLYDLARRLKTPMVILVPLGSNMGPHNGLSFIERYIDEISKVSGITVVVPIGNQGDSDTHTSGTIAKVGNTMDIELKIDENQKNIKFEIWVSKPDKFALSIVSPSGEIIQRIPSTTEKITEIKFLYESTIIYVQYFMPEVSTGEELITIKARNIKEGIWVFKLIGELVITGRYDAYLIQRELLAPGTIFLKPDPYVTLTIPSSSAYAISVGYYNQNNNSNVRESGRGYTRDDRVKPDLVAGGVNALVTTVGSGTQVVSGSSVAAAVVAGCCALIFQWGIIDGNDTSLYSTKVKTYLIGGTSKREGDIYPNPQWGYGAVDMKGVFNNIRLKTNELSEHDIFMKKPIDENEYYVGNLFIRLPI
ncbi:S8 family serine peptidase [Clostridium gasigenes]|uniref:S8 family serine peptidase n=1 Tax=Clostridium gasigenes TaxID=94869 RepID=UPI003F4A7763